MKELLECQPQAVKNNTNVTLMDAYHRLQDRVGQAQELLGLSVVLNDKFSRIERGINKEAQESEKTPEPDLVELFCSISDMLEGLMYSTGNNINKVNSLID